MVGGLVQKQDIRLLKKQFAKSHPGLLAAGEGIDGLGEIRFLKAKTLQDAGDLALAGVAIFRLKLSGQPVVGLHFFFKPFTCKVWHGKFDLPDPLLHLENVRLGGTHFLVNGVVAGHLLVLGKIAQGLVFGDGDRARVGEKFSHDHLKQSGLSCAV